MEDRLRKFARVAETGSFTRAAADLHISQPALSAAISKLERELDAVLFLDRKPPLQLTEAGRAAYHYTKELDVRADNLKTELARLAHKKPTLKIGMIDSIAHALLVQGNYLRGLKEQAHISLTIDNSRSLLEALQQGEQHMIITARRQKPYPKAFRLTPLGDESLIAVTSAINAPETKEALANGQLPNFLGYDKASNTNRLIRRYFNEQNVELQTVFRSTSPEILLQMTLTGEGPTVLPYAMVKKTLARQTLTSISPPIARPIVALEQRDRTATPLSQTLYKSLQQLLARS